jgi:hypothetical protein
MDYIKVNGFDLPVLRKDREICTYSLGGIKYEFIKKGISEVLHINSNFRYRTKYYYNLFDCNGNIIKTGIETEFEDIKSIESVSDINWSGGKKIVLFLNGEFVLLTVDNSAINTIDQVISFNKILNCKYNTYSTANSTPFDYKMDFVPHYNIIRGHSRYIFGMLSRKDIQMTYKELKSKINIAKKLYKEEIKYDLDKDFEDMESVIVKSLSRYLMLTEKQYKAGRFNLIKQLNKRLNYNINNKK